MLQAVMAASGYHIAQVNIARVRAPVDSPELADFVALLDPINAIADTSPGFVWRLQTEDGNATALRVFGKDDMLVNMSVWKDVTSLRAFVYETRHLGVFKRRNEWFHPLGEAYLALWWIPAGYIPTVADAEERIMHLRAHGPTPFAFTFTAVFEPSGVAT
jgi:uncharacterized protein DUF3291